MTNPKKYVLIPESIFDDERLDPGALGVFAYILSQPANWPIDAEVIAKRFHSDAQTITSIISDLEDLGYLSEVKS